MNPTLFQRKRDFDVRPADATTAEGGPAYAFDAKHALAQYAATGCLNDTFYATAEMQLDAVLALCTGVPADFIARTAVWCRERGFMKDLPALLCALLTVEDPALCERVFDRVIDDGKMLRNFVQVMRSGLVGRGSLASMPRRLVRRWFERRTDEQVFRASIGADPSLADVVRMAHPRPATPSRRALYAWLIGKPYDVAALPSLVADYEAYKAHRRGTPPDVPFLMLTALDLGAGEWRQIARRATWTQLRMNLNAFARHGVFKDCVLTKELAWRLRDPEQIRQARVLPYQLLTAYQAAKDVPDKIRDALHDAMEIATGNVPKIDGRVYVCPDVSGSMQSPVTGFRRGSTTKTRCIDVAALMAASMLRRNPDAEVLPFEDRVVDLRLRAKDPVLRNAQRLAAIGGGGTSCSAPLAYLNARHAEGDLVVFVSDNESWADLRRAQGTAMMNEWHAFKARNPRAKLVCIDVQPNRTTQAHEAGDVLNVGGFSDAVFEVVAAFARGDRRTWVQTIESVEI